MTFLYAKRLNRDWEQRLITFLTEKELWSRIAEDGNMASDFEPKFVPGVSYVGLFDASLLFGILILHEENMTTYSAHINIHAKHRKEYAKKAGVLCMQYIAWRTSIMKINTQVPSMYKDVISWLIKCGFTYEGINRSSIMKEGSLVSQLRFGITIDEIQELI